MAENKNNSFKEKTKLQAANQQLRAGEQQLRATNQQLRATEQQLRAANQQLKADEQQLKAELKRVNHDMSEYIRELNCLYGLSELIEQYSVHTKEVFKGLVDLIPPAWQYPDITCARIIVENREFKTANFKLTKWIQSANINIAGGKGGTIEVCYLKEMPAFGEGPFLAQEKKLLEVIGHRLGKLLEHRKTTEQVKAANQQLRASNQQLKALNQQLLASEQEIRKKEAETREARKFAESIVDTLREPFVILDGDLRIVTAGQSFYNTFKVTPEETEGKLIYNLSNRQWDIPKLRELLENILPNNSTFNNYKVEHDFKTIGRKITLLNARKLKQETGKTQMILLAIEDITERRQAEQESISLAKFPSENPYPVLRIGKDGKVLYSNKAGEQLLFKWNSKVGKTVPEKWYNLITEVFASEEEEEEEEVKGKIFSFIITPVKEAGYANLYARDITDRKRAEKKVLEKQKQLRSLAIQASSSEERERRRIAEGLHDDIIQPLAFLDIKLKTFLASDTNSALTDSYQRMRTIIGKLINDVRDFTFDLSYPVLYELGFEKAVKQWLTSEIKGKHGLQTIFKDDRQMKPLDNDIRIFLFKAVKELLVNVIKHADATKVKVSLAKNQGNIVVCVEDDGVGFSVNKKPKDKMTGFGLFSIRDRMDYLGGCFEIKSRHGSGTKAVITIPLKQEKTT